MIYYNGKQIPTSTILLILFVLLLLFFPKTVFTVLLFGIYFIVFAFVFLFYRIRNWIAFFKNIRDPERKTQMPRFSENEKGQVYDCRDYEVIHENKTQKKESDNKN